MPHSKFASAKRAIRHVTTLARSPQVLQELVGDKSLERFRSEYDKLHRALKKSHESEKRLIKKCRELNQVRVLPCEYCPRGIP